MQVTSAKNYILILLVLTVLGGAGLAWTQYRELVELRAAALSPNDRDQLQKRIWDLESLNRSLQDEMAALQGANPGDPDGMLADASPERPAPERGRARGGRGPNGPQQQLNALRDLAAKPEVQALLRVQQQAAIDARYAALFRNLNLAPEQLSKLKNLLAERQTTLQDVMMAARDQGVDPRSDPAGFRKLIADTQNEINNSIKGIVGENGFTQLQTYEQTLPQRNIVNDLQQRLSYTDTPLTQGQAEQLVQILASNAPQRGANNAGGANNPSGAGNPAGVNRGALQGIRGGGGGGLGGGFGGGFGGGGGPGGDLGGMLAGALGGGGGPAGGATAPVTSAAVAQAQTILAPPQVTALQQIQQQQQSQQQLQQLLRTTVGNQGGQNRGGGQTGGQPPAGGGGTGRRGGG